MEHIQNYLIVLFKNKTKKKIINKFKTYKKAIEFYNNLLHKSNDVLFPVNYENGLQCDYEIALLERNIGTSNTLFNKDEFGRQVRVELDDSDFRITKISPYYTEELFVDYSTGNKITTEFFLKNYLNKDGYKLISKLNNKVVIQIDDNFNLFTFKSLDDSDRFIDTLTEKFKNEKRGDCLLVKDYDTSQRKYLYDILTEKGFTKTYLQRQSTTHHVKK
jgi:cellulose synthase/poly-beta-1,6-N-acetylglucosamine synthase-like glycosyltransferase